MSIADGVSPVAQPAGHRNHFVYLQVFADLSILPAAEYSLRRRSSNLPVVDG